MGKVLRSNKCEHCGGAVYAEAKKDGAPRKRRYCSHYCHQTAWKIRKGFRVTGRTRAQITQEIAENHTYTCQGCGKEYLNKRRRNGEGEKYCSRECAYSNQKQWNVFKDKYHRTTHGRDKHWGKYSELPEYCIVKYSNCKECGDVYVKRGSSPYCHKHRGYTPIERQANCKICGNSFIATGVGSGLSAYCSSECRYIGNQQQTRAAKKKRDALIRGARKGETVYRTKVFDRDGWTCQVCGCDTPKELKGTLEDNAPELDHIVPVSKGGHHSYANTQCLCRICNILKTDKSMDDFVKENKGLGGRS